MTRSVLAAELFVAANGFDHGSMVRQAHNEIYGRVIDMDLWVDAKCFWDCVTGMKTTTEKRLLIDLTTMRDTYELRELRNVFLFPSKENPSNSLTKRVFSHALQCILKDNRLKLNPNAWVKCNRKASRWQEKMTVAKATTSYFVCDESRKVRMSQHMNSN